MFISKCYKFIENRIVYVGSNVPEGAEILTIMDILNAESGFELVRNSDGENIGNSVWLKDDDNEKNYTEVKIPETSETQE